jgi:hypothetical protein
MGRSLKGKKGGVSWLALVDYALQELREHLEFQFEDGMTWENYGSWHIDHRKPISWFSFETPDDEQFKDCWALSNLKPMWGEDNLKKSNRYAD